MCNTYSSTALSLVSMALLLWVIEMFVFVQYYNCVHVGPSLSPDILHPTTSSINYPLHTTSGCTKHKQKSRAAPIGNTAKPLCTYLTSIRKNIPDYCFHLTPTPGSLPFSAKCTSPEVVLFPSTWWLQNGQHVTHVNPQLSPSVVFIIFITIIMSFSPTGKSIHYDYYHND